MVIEMLFIILESWKNLKSSTIAVRLSKPSYIISYGTLTSMGLGGYMEMLTEK